LAEVCLGLDVDDGLEGGLMRQRVEEVTRAAHILAQAVSAASAVEELLSRVAGDEHLCEVAPAALPLARTMWALALLEQVSDPRLGASSRSDHAPAGVPAHETSAIDLAIAELQSNGAFWRQYGDEIGVLAVARATPPDEENADTLAATLHAHLAASFPAEGGAFILGHDGTRVVFPLRNALLDTRAATNRFAAHQDDPDRAAAFAATFKLDAVAHVHSHPRGAAWPSGDDTAELARLTDSLPSLQMWIVALDDTPTGVRAVGARGYRVWPFTSALSGVNAVVGVRTDVLDALVGKES
jgi:proteasome lid subunit RPN8/RPN11